MLAKLVYHQTDVYTPILNSGQVSVSQPVKLGRQADKHLMSKYLDKEKRDENRIKQILLQDWNPIDVAEMPEAQDEYDAYVRGVYHRLLHRVSKQELFDYLWEIETKHMGLYRNRSHTNTVVEKLMAIRENSQVEQIGNSMSKLSRRVKRKLWERFTDFSKLQLDENGYVSTAEENLLPGVNLDDFEKDFQQGSGNELENKFLAVHSSSALAANTFAPWRNMPFDLFLCGHYGFEEIVFERKCPTGLSGMPPNLDLFLRNDSVTIGVESKFLEYLAPKPPKFSASYNRDNFPNVEEAWWNVLENKRGGKAHNLDVAQLIKHYLGLRNQMRIGEQQVILLYLFWEPTNW